MSDQNWIDPNHPHGPPDPRWITDDGRCLLCADSYHKGKITKLESQLTASQARVKELEQEQAALTQALKVEYSGSDDKMSGDLIDDLTCFVEHHKKKEQRITTLEQALKASNNQILELINGGTSLLAHTPDAPLLSDGGTAQSFFRVQVTLAKEVINANLKTIGNSA